MKWHWYYWPMLPFSVVPFIAALAVMLWYRPTKVRWSKGCIEFIAGTFQRDGAQVTRIWGRPMAQCLGVPIVAYASEDAWNRGKSRVHERIHAVHGLLINFGFTLGMLPLIITVIVTNEHWLWHATPIVAGQLAFGLSYFAHWLYNVAFDAPWPDWWHPPMKPLARWYRAYRRIYTERIAYRRQENYPPGVWGA